MTPNTSEGSKNIVINLQVPLLKNIFCVPLRAGNIFLGLAGAIFYFVIGACLIHKYSIDITVLSEKLIYGSIIVLSFAHSIACSIFIVGVFQKNVILIYPWLCSHAIITADIVFAYLLSRPTPEILFYVFNWMLFQMFIWHCGYSFYERTRTRGISYNSVPVQSGDKYQDMFASLQQSAVNTRVRQAKGKHNTFDIKIHEPLK